MAPDVTPYVDRPRERGRKGVWCLLALDCCWSHVYIRSMCLRTALKNARRALRFRDRECRCESRGSHYRARPVQRNASTAETRSEPPQTVVTLAILIHTDCCFVASGGVSCAARRVRMRATGGCPGVAPFLTPPPRVTTGDSGFLQLFYRR